ncbi:MAG: hypothetical protein LBP36_01160 [Oscillospiraceae bacterium]|jgi:hypothetical protein|nr:hypothetical protein [Oscillospiraceae bacterium]
MFKKFKTVSLGLLAFSAFSFSSVVYQPVKSFSFFNRTFELDVRNLGECFFIGDDGKVEHSPRIPSVSFKQKVNFRDECLIIFSFDNLKQRQLFKFELLKLRNNTLVDRFLAGRFSYVCKAGDATNDSLAVGNIYIVCQGKFAKEIRGMLGDRSFTVNMKTRLAVDKRGDFFGPVPPFELSICRIVKALGGKPSFIPWVNTCIPPANSYRIPDFEEFWTAYYGSVKK